MAVLRLSSSDQRMLSGEEGEARRLSMLIIVAPRRPPERNR
jgi:predicted aconitase